MSALPPASVPTGLLAPALRAWAEGQIGPIDGVVLLSAGVWRVRAEGREWVLKHLLDHSGASRVEAFVSGRLASWAAVRRVRALAERDDGSVFVLAPYVSGRALDVQLVDAPPALAREWAIRVCEVLAEIASLPVAGYGAVRLVDGALLAGYSDWASFLGACLEARRGEAPRLAGARYAPMRAALNRFDEPLRMGTPWPVLVSCDVGLGNFVVDGPVLTCVNVPGVWSGDLACAHGEALLHWAGTAGEAVFRSAGSGAGPLLDLYAAFHAYVILARVERFDPDSLESAVVRGGRVPLLRLLDRHLEAVLAG